MTAHLPRPHRNALAATGLRSRARERPHAARLAGPAGPPSARAVLGELGAGLAAGRLAGALPRLLTAPRGDGHPVLDIPGWRAPEVSGAPSARLPAGAGSRRPRVGLRHEHRGPPP